ncbi:hypothetical protein C449_00465 [Halococcus saccharolyticus DSM 5350]|uniref:Uncharacterized protein n=1 Tax=Halococcus saccharolyticus DSM 5350 TaxID=1227455 RepID=M0MT27_9EURY|nr:DUF389 domain-containing protein [Halococcus saccharolyticus]EMA47899.1 hypothetical protein C449_00465 [Halococcus saccharolyticus DSM 5350]
MWEETGRGEFEAVVSFPIPPSGVEPDLARRGIVLQVGCLVLAIVCAAVLDLNLKTTVLVPPGLDITEVPQIAERTQPNFLALGSGIAASISSCRPTEPRHGDRQTSEPDNRETGERAGRVHSDPKSDG